MVERNDKSKLEKGFCSSPEIIMLFVYMKYRFSLSDRDLEEMASIRGAAIYHATLQRWLIRFVPLINIYDIVLILAFLNYTNICNSIDSDLSRIKVFRACLKSIIIYNFRDFWI